MWQRGLTGAVAFGLIWLTARGQEDPRGWFPLQAGNRWVYEHEAKSGDRNQPHVDSWTTEQIITRLVTVPEGLVVLREVKLQTRPNEQIVMTRMIGPNGQLRSVQEPTYNRGILTARDGQPYLVRGNCVYVIDGGWDERMQELRAQYRKYLSAGALSPDFCFPLQSGQEWGNTDIPWRVEPARENTGSFLPAEFRGAIHIFSSHFGSGGWEDVWFQKGIGVVGEHYIHNGTYDEYTKKLISVSR